MKNYTYFFIGVITVILLVGSTLVQISVSNSLTTEGLKLSKIQEQIDETKKENLLLAERVYSASSYTQIASQAARIGFVQAKQPIFLSDNGPLALKQ
ncbi:MAG TPA: hypothetical protein VLG12_00630 [Candidatus Saccharimonadales bacterium]|nr:hypothetical protein [Candidatus Saccharimonadales bacterium]